MAIYTLYTYVEGIGRMFIDEGSTDDGFFDAIFFVDVFMVCVGDSAGVECGDVGRVILFLMEGDV